jgi:hypothetical protein
MPEKRYQVNKDLVRDGVGSRLSGTIESLFGSWAVVYEFLGLGVVGIDTH